MKTNRQVLVVDGQNLSPAVQKLLDILHAFKLDPALSLEIDNERASFNPLQVYGLDDFYRMFFEGKEREGWRNGDTLPTGKFLSYMSPDQRFYFEISETEPRESTSLECKAELSLRFENEAIAVFRYLNFALTLEDDRSSLLWSKAERWHLGMGNSFASRYPHIRDWLALIPRSEIFFDLLISKNEVDRALIQAIVELGRKSDVSLLGSQYSSWGINPPDSIQSQAG